MPKITIELTDEELTDILETAGDHGCGYWLRTDRSLVDLIRPRKGYGIAQHVVMYDYEGGEYKDGATVYPEFGWLNLGMVRGAANRLAELTAEGKFSARAFCQLVNEPEACDATVADALVQVALFGEVRFG